MDGDLVYKEVTRKLQQLAIEVEPILACSDLSECPHCGIDEELTTAIVVYDHIAATEVSMQSGPWNAADWKVLRYCEKCRQYFYTEDCNY